MIRLLIISIFSSYMLTACEKSVRGLADMYKWINNPDHGMLKTKTVEGIKLTVKYLPPELLALKESTEKTFTQHTYDSLFLLYKQSYTFLLTIASTQNENSNDLLYKNLEDIPHFKERVLTMNFGMHDYLSLRTSSEEMRPVLATMENTYSLKGQRNIYVVFSEDPKKLPARDELDFVFDDEIFETGENHFVFKQKDLTGLPAVDFKNINP